MNEEENSLTHFQWIQIYEKLKNEGNYKFLYTDVEAYEKKLNKMLSQDYRYHKNLMKKSEHNLLLDSLKTNFLKISSDLHLLDLSQLALCIDNTFDSLLNCLRSAFLGFTNCISLMREEHSSNQSKYFSLERCQQCQSHIEKIKIESLKTSITLCEGKPSQSQMNRLNSQLNDLGFSFEDVELSLMIDEVLQGKDNVLNAKNNQITAIYEEIAQYLENIPKQTLTMGREEESMTERNKFLGINSISKQIQNGLTEMLQDPIRKFITRVFYFFKKKQKQKSYVSVETQTQILTDQETIKSLNKSYEKLKREFENLKSAKRQSERDYIRMIEEKQVNEIKIKQLTTINEFLTQKNQRVEKDLKKIRKSLQDCENSKRQLSQNLIKQYTAEKSSFLRNIHQLELTLESSNNEIKRLRKITQGSMMSREVQVNFSSVSVEVQTADASSSSFEDMQLLFPSNGEILKNNSSMISRRGQKLKKSANNIEQSSSKCSEVEIIQPSSEIEPQELRSTVIEKQLSSKTSIKEVVKEEFFQQKMKRVEMMQNDRILTKITVKIDQQQLEGRNSNRNSDNYSLAQESIATSGKIGSLPHSKCPSKQKLQWLNSNKRRETINTGEIRGLNLKIQGKKRVEKACSSRMFMPVQHCSPYIGPKHQGEMNWLQIIESNKSKKYCDDLQRELSNEEDIEKISFISKLFFNYENLKNDGLLDEIQSMMLKHPEIFKKKQKQKYDKKVSSLKIQIPNFQKNSSYARNTKRQEKIIQMQPSCSQIPITPSKNTQKIGNPVKSKENGKKKHQAKILHLQNLSTNINTPLEGHIFGNSPIFIKKHILLLFDSEILMKKYEKCEEIWSLLESSMMVDSSFGTQCDNACTFILKLEKSNPRLYQQCIDLFKFPFRYLKKVEKNQTAPGKIQLFKKKVQHNLHKRHFSGLLNKQNEGEEFVNISPSELRHTLIKLFRFHKVIHGKCAHVQEFLAIIGFKPSSP